ncbi:MAG: SAM hydrolase/SAM-dependent halogenase family protein [Pyrinomonadaceae bacterium]
MIVTLLTDFGTVDYYVGALKGAILSAQPSATLVDITHESPAHDVEAGAFTLLAAYEAFPPGTVHVAVVDPEVGSERRPLIVEAGGYFFVGPDNGLFSYVCERESEVCAFHLTERQYFRPNVSATFHGRDIFAPVAGALARGVAPRALGEEVSDFVRLEPLAPRMAADGTLEARVIHIDRFGNCVTNLTCRELPEEVIRRGVRLEVCGRAVSSFRRFFAEGVDAGDEIFAIWGSAGFLEFAARCASAAAILEARRGQPVTAKFRL